jgi:hypothetical protein
MATGDFAGPCASVRLGRAEILSTFGDQDVQRMNFQIHEGGVPELLRSPSMLSLISFHRQEPIIGNDPEVNRESN